MRVPQVSERIKEAPAQALRGVFAGIGQLLLITDKLRHKASTDSDVPQARTPEASETVTDVPVTSPGDQRAETAAAPAEAVAAGETVATEPAPAEPVPAEPVPAESATAKPATARRTAAKPATAKPAAKAAPARRTAAKAAAAEPAAEAPPKPPKRQSTRDFDKTGNVRLLGDEAGSSPLGAAAAAAPEPAVAPEPASVTEPAAGAVAAAPPLPSYDELSVASLRARL